MYLIELVRNAARFQSQILVGALLDAFDDLDHLLVVLSSDLTHLSEVNVVGDQAFFNAIPQQPHNLVSVPKNENKQRLFIIKCHKV